MNIISDFIPAGRRNRPAYLLTPAYITIHDTGNTSKGAGALSHAKYLKGDAAANAPVSWHFTVDDKQIVQHLPTDENGWHCGDGANGPGNRTTIGVEIAENSDGNRAQAEANAAELVASLLRQHNLTLDKVVQHNHWKDKNCPRVLRGRAGGWEGFLGQIEGFLTPNDARLIVYGKEIPGGAKLIDGKAYTWTRGLAEALGLRTDWDAATKTVTIGNAVTTLPNLEHRSNCDVITCKPSQLAVSTVKGRLTVDGINASFFDAKLNPLGVVVIDHQAVADRVPHRQPRPVFIITKDSEAIISPAVESVSRLALDEVVYAVGAGPNLLPTLNTTDYPDDIAKSTRERVAVGITPQGLVKLVVTDPMTMQQLAALMKELGCRFAMALDGGGSQTMRFGGKAIRDGGRKISTALILREG